MKNKYKILISSVMAISVILGGCSLNKDEALQPTEYLSDTENTESVEATTNDAASSDQSIVVVENLFEPILEALNEENVPEEATEATSEENTDTNEDEIVRMVFFGDSQIANGRNDGSDIPNIMTTRIPNSVAYNLAIGGTTATVEATTSDVSPDKLQSTSFLGMTYCYTGKADRNQVLANQQNILNIMNSIDPATVDYYFIEYGANDFFEGAPLDASIYASDGEKAHALYNAMCMGINELKSVSPNAKFMIITPFYGIYVSDDGTYIGDSYIVSNGVGTLSDYAKKVVNVAEDTTSYYIDTMFREHTDLYLDTANEYLMDNLHLTLKGRQIFSRIFAHYVNFEEHNEPFAYLDTDFIKIAEYDTEEYYRYNEDWMKAYYPESWEKYIRGEFPLAQPSQEALDAYNAEQQQNGG
ncbi:SGNH/GDSL hydrolase family protein [Butyrivibrio sp. VCB2001]|uniref:SGNH/GDSL hydrolase family protein n=1 Tax=Butyrivibrio sp. VCB2001 TaxID=1280667 RepID=UPI0003FD242F|nr:SGNH/GDSL hydrolase family protein [Butyrivibrio sp. VCB2001]